MAMTSGSGASEVEWARTVLADEGALRKAFAERPVLVKKLIANKGFLHALFDGQGRAFATLLATPAEEGGDVDALLGLVGAGGDGGSETPRQAQVGAQLERWLDDPGSAQAFHEHPGLARALAANPAFAERLKLFSPEIFRELLAKGKARFHSDASVLEAIAASERTLVTFSVEGGWSNEGADAGGKLIAAADKGDRAAAEALLGRPGAKSFINHQDAAGLTALTWAAWKGHTGIAALLLEKGADPSLRDTAGRTALMLAAREGHQDIAALLLSKGADPNLRDGGGQGFGRGR
jgi:hypothetical protein